LFEPSFSALPAQNRQVWSQVLAAAYRFANGQLMEVSMASLVRRANGIYHIVDYVKGRRVWKSTGYKTLSRALRILNDSPQEPDHKPTPDLEQSSVQLLTHLSTNLAHSTVLLYRSAFKQLIKHLGNLPMDQYTPQLIEQFKTSRLAEVTPIKVNIDFRTLRAAFNIAVNWGIIQENPFRKCKTLRIPPKRPSYLSSEDFQKVLAVIEREWYKDIVRFAISTMMRVGEIVNLFWTSVDLENRLILVENTKEFRLKTHKPRTIPMNDWVYSFLKSKERKGERVFTFPDGRPFLIGYVSHEFKKYARKAGLDEGIHFHSLRHTGATWLVQGDVPIYAVQQILGHSTVMMTQIYSHLEVKHLSNSVKQLDKYFKNEVG
jgi:integrase/recombinase XerC